MVESCRARVPRLGRSTQRREPQRRPRQCDHTATRAPPERREHSASEPDRRAGDGSSAEHRREPTSARGGEAEAHRRREERPERGHQQRERQAHPEGPPPAERTSPSVKRRRRPRRVRAHGACAKGDSGQHAPSGFGLGALGPPRAGGSLMTFVMVAPSSQVVRDDRPPKGACAVPEPFIYSAGLLSLVLRLHYRDRRVFRPHVASD